MTAAQATGQTDVLRPEEETFSRLVAKGHSQIDAYREATGSKATPEAAAVTASRWAAKCRLRIEALGALRQDKSATEYVYEYEDAMREIDEARQIAKAKEDAKAMVAASALKSKLAGLETEMRKNNRRPYEELSDVELDEKISQKLPEAGYTIQ